MMGTIDIILEHLRQHGIGSYASFRHGIRTDTIRLDSGLERIEEEFHRNKCAYALWIDINKLNNDFTMSTNDHRELGTYNLADPTSLDKLIRDIHQFRLNQ